MTLPEAPPPSPRGSRRILWAVAVLIAAGLVALGWSNDWSRTFGLDRREMIQAAYLVIILIAVGSVLAGRGMGAGEAARAIAGWVVIALILVGGYAYRMELSGVGGRLLGVLLPGIPISGQLAGEPDGSVVVMRAIDGHFAVHASVDEKRTTLLVDTGASFVTLTA